MAASASASGLEFDFSEHTVSYGGTKVSLTKNEFVILRLLSKKFGQIVSREDLQFGTTHSLVDTKSRSIDVHISSLRKKIGGIGPFAFKAIYGRGYCLAAIPAES